MWFNSALILIISFPLLTLGFVCCCFSSSCRCRVRLFINKSTKNKCWQGCGEKGTLVHCWWQCRLVQPLWKTVWNFLRKLKIELPFDLEIPLLYYTLRTLKHQFKRTYAPHPAWGPNPQPRHVPWLGIQPETFRHVGQRPINWATPVRAVNVFFFLMAVPTV